MKNSRRRQRRECRTPDKKRYTKAEAKLVADALYRNDQRRVWPYRCPSGGHWHIGRRMTTGW